MEPGHIQFHLLVSEKTPDIFGRNLTYTEVNQVRKKKPNYDYLGITPVGNQLNLDSYRINETNQLCFLA